MKWTNLYIGALLCLCGACSNEVDFGEQYKKQVYIVNANLNAGIIDASLMMEEQAKGSITVYCASSEFPNEDIVVHYAIDTAALNAYNLKEYEYATELYMTAIPAELVTFETETVTIKQGEPYAVLPFTINTAALDPSANNALPITLTNASGYEINPELQTCYYRLELDNPYSGEYSAKVDILGAISSTGSYYPMFENAVTKTLLAAGMSALKVPQATQVAVQEGENPNYFTIDWNQEDNSLTLTSPVEGFKMIETLSLAPEYGAEAEEIKVNCYNPETEEFVICYQFPNASVIYETLKKK